MGEAHGIDLIAQRVEMTRRLYPRIHIIEGNAMQLPYEDNSFDFVMQFMCFSSILDCEMHKKIASEMWRVLKPGGSVLWYDLRPLLKPFESIIRFCSRQNESIPILKIPLSEIVQLFPKGSIKYKKVSLILKLASLSGQFYMLSCFLSLCPALRTHYLVLIKKFRD